MGFTIEDKASVINNQLIFNRFCEKYATNKAIVHSK
jgi:hypothetical protein